MKRDELQSIDEILQGKVEKVQHRKEWRHFLAECIVTMVSVYVIFQYVIGIAFVSGSSMEPTLKDRELVVFYRLDETYQRDDLVILRMPGDVEYIKRIVAEPGETVELSEDGKLLVNGKEQTPEEAMGVTAALSEDIAYPYTVPEGSYFVLGDNRENSRDSRSFGAVKQGQIAGRVFLHMGMTR